MRAGQKFIHSFWIKDLETMEPAECMVVGVNDKEITYRSLEANDRRVGKCKPKEFSAQMKKWIA